MQAVQHAIDNFGGQKALADAIGVSQPTVSQWLKPEEEYGRPVPPKRCVRIELHPTNKAARKPVMRWDLRPDDWWEHWPDLIGAKGAPKVKLAKAA